MIAARAFLKRCRLKDVDGFPRGPVARAVRNNSQRPEDIARRLHSETRNDQAAEDVINRRSLAPHRASQTGSVENPMVVQIVDVTNGPSLKRVPARERGFVHPIMPIDVWYGIRKPNRPSNPD